jgi:hypothetical protein
VKLIYIVFIHSIGVGISVSESRREFGADAPACDCPIGARILAGIVDAERELEKIDAENVLPISYQWLDRSITSALPPDMNGGVEALKDRQFAGISGGHEPVIGAVSPLTKY